MKRYVLFFVLLCVSCTKLEDPIGNYPVYLRLDLTTKDKELRTIGSSKSYMLKDVNPNIERVGFGGVLVVHALDDQFHAFDLACPYEVNQGVRVAADENNLFAICPKCGTKYDIAFGSGAPDGVSKYYLKRYTVTGSGTQLTVTN